VSASASSASLPPCRRHWPAGSTDTPVESAAARLGNGSRVLAEDTVPFTVWMASREGSFEESLWQTVSALGDRDTTAAIVGGIIALKPGIAPPAEWLARREPLAHFDL